MFLPGRYIHLLLLHTLPHADCWHPLASQMGPLSPGPGVQFERKKEVERDGERQGHVLMALGKGPFPWCSPCTGSFLATAVAVTWSQPSAWRRNGLREGGYLERTIKPWVQREGMKIIRM